jgi:hypothetical protein
VQAALYGAPIVCTHDFQAERRWPKDSRAAFITNTGHGLVCGQLGGLELRHRQHARMEDRIRQTRATGLRNLSPVRRERRMAGNYLGGN